MKVSMASALFVLLLATSARAQMDIESAELAASVDRVDGVLLPAPYSFDVTVTGVNIVGVTLQTPNGATHALILVDGEWQYHKHNLASLVAMSNDSDVGFGTFVFTFFGPGGVTETASAVFDPGLSDPHSGYASISFPTNGQTGVSSHPTFTWTCANPPCGSFAWYLEVFPVSGIGLGYDEGFLIPTSSEWTPGPLSGGTQYGLWISSGTILGPGIPQSLSTTPGGDAFDYVPGFETVNQLEFTTSEADSHCYEDGSVLACPCANLGLFGRGCDNSAATGGAKLAASGTTVPDTLVLTSSGELPTVLSIFLQGTSTISPVVFGDGLLCVGGTLKLLYTKQAVSGTVSAPDAGDPSITNRSAMLGDPILPGTQRAYQVYYRDPNLGFCASPPGDSWNVSSGVLVSW